MKILGIHSLKLKRVVFCCPGRWNTVRENTWKLISLNWLSHKLDGEWINVINNLALTWTQ